MPMVRWPVLVALLVSLGICGFFEVRGRQKYAETQQQIAMRKADTVMVFGHEPGQWGETPVLTDARDWACADCR